MSKIEIPKKFSVKKSILVSQAELYEFNVSTEEKHNLIYEEQFGFVTNKSNYVKKEDAKKLGESNLQTSDNAFLSNYNNLLRINFIITFCPLDFNKYKCQYVSLELKKRLNEVVEEYKNWTKFEELARRYVINILNMSFAWRNIELGLPYQLKIIPCKSYDFEEPIIFTKDDYGKGKIDFRERNKFFIDDKSINDKANILIKLVQSVLSNELDFLNFLVIADIKTYNNEIWPSQKYVKGELKRHYYTYNGMPAFTRQKVGNAIRTIDTWYTDFQELRIPLPISPFAPDRTSGLAKRLPNQDDFYTFEKEILENGKSIKSLGDNAHYFIANLIHGGVFGLVNNKELNNKE